MDNSQVYMFGGHGSYARQMQTNDAIDDAIAYASGESTRLQQWNSVKLSLIEDRLRELPDLLTMTHLTGLTLKRMAGIDEFLALSSPEELLGHPMFELFSMADDAQSVMYRIFLRVQTILPHASQGKSASSARKMSHTDIRTSLKLYRTQYSKLPTKSSLEEYTGDKWELVKKRRLIGSTYAMTPMQEKIRQTDTPKGKILNMIRSEWVSITDDWYLQYLQDNIDVLTIAEQTTYADLAFDENRRLLLVPKGDKDGVCIKQEGGLFRVCLALKNMVRRPESCTGYTVILKEIFTLDKAQDVMRYIEEQWKDLQNKDRTQSVPGMYEDLNLQIYFPLSAKRSYQFDEKSAKKRYFANTAIKAYSEEELANYHFAFRQLARFHKLNIAWDYAEEETEHVD